MRLELLMVLALSLVLCDGRIVEYRRPSRDREMWEESYEELISTEYSSPEDIYEERNTQRERTLRASVYQPSYGFTKSYKRKFNGDGDLKKQKKSKYVPNKSRGKYLTYGKSAERSFTRPTPNFEAEFGDRRKEHRSAPRYEQPPYFHRPSASIPLNPTYRPVLPKPACQQKLLIGCAPTVSRVPCGFGQAAYSQQDYVLGSPNPSFQAEPFNQGPLESQSYFQPPVQSPPSLYDSNQGIAPAPYDQPPKAFYQPPPPSGYNDYQAQYKPTSTPTRPSKVHHTQINSFIHIKPTNPQHSPPAAYQPILRQSNQPQFPQFSPPVSEDGQEPSAQQPPVISAFPTPAAPQPISTTPKVPTSSPNQPPPDKIPAANNPDQNLQPLVVPSATNPPPVVDLFDDTPPKESSGDYPDQPAIPSSTPEPAVAVTSDQNDRQQSPPADNESQPQPTTPA
ncbi:uncharacterized protein LOC129742148 [Uranotaenia lowii]|uniref:uncharacterized protein LOC129742148 n=1 Tax=Uranotaenia lowii TaxID=190385 RepID=UPI00247B13B0|nr:uncharacterized protein LOC129742148 [Uranotaenia lowii]